jgi:high affinity sulfate transporter 1
MNIGAAPPIGWRSAFPPAQWLAGYHLGALPRDAVAGLTLAAYAIPVSLAYATLAGLPPQAGIYGCMAGGVAYALFGSSRQLAIGPTSAISMLVGATIGGLAGGSAARYADIAALTALVVGAMSLLAWALRLSSLVAFISETILLGFKAGAAVTIAVTQLPKLFGVPGGGEHFFERIAILARQLPDTDIAVLLLGLAALGLILAGEKLLPGRPVALGVMALTIVALSTTSLGGHGFPVVGDLPSGLPALRLPELRLRDVDGVIPLAFACLLLAYVEGVSAARTLAQRHGDAIDARQELLGLGAANLAAALAQGYPVAGGLSQSSVNDKAGATSALALVVASLATGMCLLYLGGLLHNLPDVVLAAIVLVAVKGLIDLGELRHLWRANRFEFGVSMTAFAGVLLLGTLKGVMLAAVTSLLLLIRRAARPHVAFGAGRTGVLVIRVDASLLYFNAEHVLEVVWARLRSAASVRQVVCDLSSSPHVDLAGARMLSRLRRELQAAAIDFRLTGANEAVRDVIRAEGPLVESLDEVDRAAGDGAPRQEAQHVRN